jgi:hypothetical protein
MDDWSGLRIAAVVVVWATVAGGLVLGTLWFVFGGGRSVGPEDETLAIQAERDQGTDVVQSRTRRITSFSTAQVGMHGLLGLITAGLLTYAAVRDSDRGTGYVTVLVAIAITAIPALLMFRKWRSGARPSIAGVTDAATDRRVEDRLPSPVVYLHGVAAVSTATLVVILLAVDR